MAKSKVQNPLPTTAYRDYTLQELKRLRYWFAGAKVTGGTVPTCENSVSALQKAIRLIEDHVDSKD